MIIQKPGQKILTIGNPGLQIISPRGGAVSFDPSSISGLAAWFDYSDPTTMYTDAGSSLVSSDGDAIYQVSDKSGNGALAYQSESSYRPLYKTAIQNGLSAALFDGSNDVFLVSGLGLTDAFTIIFVYRINTWQTSDFVGGGNARRWLQLTNTSRVTVRPVSSQSTIELSTTLQTGSWMTNALRRDSSDNLTYWLNGTDITDSVDYTMSDNAIVGSLGARYATYTAWFNGYIGEILFYKETDLSTSDFQKIDTYLNNKWSIY